MYYTWSQAAVLAAHLWRWDGVGGGARLGGVGWRGVCGGVEIVFIVELHFFA